MELGISPIVTSGLIMQVKNIPLLRVLDVVIAVDFSKD